MAVVLLFAPVLRQCAVAKEARTKYQHFIVLEVARPYRVAWGLAPGPQWRLISRRNPNRAPRPTVDSTCMHMDHCAYTDEACSEDAQ